MTEDTLNETSTIGPAFDKTTGRVFLIAQNGRTIVVKVDKLIEQLAQLSLLDEIAADQLANLNLPGSGPAKSILKKIAQKVRAMRSAQQQYFQFKTNADLETAKALEKEADNLLDNYFKISELI